MVLPASSRRPSLAVPSSDTIYPSVTVLISSRGRNDPCTRRKMSDWSTYHCYTTGAGNMVPPRDPDDDDEFEDEEDDDQNGDPTAVIREPDE